MGAIYSAVIPSKCVEVDASSSDYTCPSHTFGFRVNTVTDGSADSVQVLTAGGTTVTFDNLLEGEDIVLRCAKILAAGTTCTSIHIYYD